MRTATASIAVLVAAGCLAWAKGPAARSAATCPAIDGLDVLLQPGTTLVFGEIHGTQEIPRFVGDVACRAGPQALVTVGLEVRRDEQRRIDAFLASQGAPADTQGLLAGPFWRRTDQDGRSSQAMLELFERSSDVAGHDGRYVVGTTHASPPAGGHGALKGALSRACARPWP